MDERYYPSDPIMKELERFGIAKDRQDLLSLLDILPKRFAQDGQMYNLEIEAYPVYTVGYVTIKEMKYGNRSGEKLVDAVAAMLLVLIQRKVIA